MLLFGVLAAIISYFALRKSGGVFRHILVLILLLIAIGLLHGFYFMSLFPNGWTTEAGGPIILASSISAAAGPLIGMLLAMSTRRGTRGGQIVAGVLLVALLAGEVANFVGLMSQEVGHTNRWSLQEVRQRNAKMKFDLGVGIAGSLLGLAMCLRKPRAKTVT